MAVHKFPVSEHTFYRVQFPFKVLEKSPGTIVTGQLFAVHGADGTFRMIDRVFESGESNKKTLVLVAESIDRPALCWVYYTPNKKDPNTDKRAKKLPPDIYPVEAIVHNGPFPIEYLISLSAQKAEGEESTRNVRVIPVPVRDCVPADNPNEVKYTIKECV